MNVIQDNRFVLASGAGVTFGYMSYSDGEWIIENNVCEFEIDYLALEPIETDA